MPYLVKATPSQLKYQRVEVEIRRLAHTLPLGAKLPAERDMAITYDCNFLTVRKALKQLVDDGTIVRRVGSGTFIAKEYAATASKNGGGTRIGILVYQGSNAYAHRVLQAIAHASLEHNVDLQSGWVQDFGDEALSLAQQLKRDGCVALTLPWFPHDFPREKVEKIRHFIEHSPLPVSLSTLIPGFEKNCFVEPGIFGVSTAIEDLCTYYHSLGHQRIAFIGPDSPGDIILQRKLASYVCYNSRENLPSHCGLVASGALAMDQLAERWKSYRGELAIISYDDEHALRFMTAMHKIGFSAPDDYCIIGYNDTEASRYSDPPLSTVHQNYDYMGHWLLKSALALAQGQICRASESPKLYLLVRSTCGGRNKIDDSFRTQFQDLCITVETDAPAHEPELETTTAASPVKAYSNETARLEALPAFE